ncbi:hypothetical protein KVT40_007173 [Elsinoe batatas]|uniref:HTH CENPB-type domain-containing protein n=1 Tax=Elsinoe batatas TaxID=2601811 RepID=A0A8K0KXM7_9PEZI|nr:hypothetical protein KVT40_007173 [Elsinoe batatas]
MEHGRDYRRSQSHTSPPWPDQHLYPHSHHGTPATEYSDYGWGQPAMPNPIIPYPYQPVDAQYQIPFEQRLDPPPMPQWPSQLTGDHSSMYKTMGVPAQPTMLGNEMFPRGMMASSSAAATSSTPNPRRTLTDDDRREMCVFAEENPTLKQIEIGARFKVDRSTVSKVLRQREKYLAGRSQRRPSIAKREKSHRNEVELALQNWAKKQRKLKMPLTEDSIRAKALGFSAAAGGGEASNPATNAGWVSTFKRSYSYSGSSRKPSVPGDESEAMSYTGSNGSRSSSVALSPAVRNLRMITSNDDLRSVHGSDSNSDARSSSRGPSMSLSSAMNPDKPPFSNDFFQDSSPFFSTSTFSTRHTPRSTNKPLRSAPDRPRRSTFPQGDPYDPKPPSSTTMLDSPMDDYTTLLESPEEHYYPAFPGPPPGLDSDTVSPTDTMNPPILPASRTGIPLPPGAPEPAWFKEIDEARRERRRKISLPSQEQAREGFETAMKYLRKQTGGLGGSEEARVLEGVQRRLMSGGRGGV